MHPEPRLVAAASPPLHQPASRGMWESHRIMQMHALFAGSGADTTFSSSSAAAVDACLPISKHIAGHLWNQSVLGRQEDGIKEDSFGESFLSLLNSTRDDVMAPEVFEGVPVACDYLKGMDMDDAGDMGAASAVAAAGAHSLDSNGPHAAIRSIERGIASSPLVYQQLGNDGAVVQVQRCIQPQDQAGASMAVFLQQLIPTSVPDDDHQPGIEIGSVSPDVVCFSGYRSRTPEELMCRDTKEQQITQLARTCSSRGSDPNKKRSAGRVGGNGKKSKSETSLTSSPKPQAPKVNLGEKITALQQIVSPFGKTDTASVLLETINYIKFLHGQIQLFSEPYLTTNSTNKDHSEEKRKAGLEHDLRSRGFCLAPVSWTPELLYHDDVLPECWTPAYRNYFYR